MIIKGYQWLSYLVIPILISWAILILKISIRSIFSCCPTFAWHMALSLSLLPLLPGFCPFCLVVDEAIHKDATAFVVPHAHNLLLLLMHLEIREIYHELMGLQAAWFDPTEALKSAKLAGWTASFGQIFVGSKLVQWVLQSPQVQKQYLCEVLQGHTVLVSSVSSCLIWFIDCSDFPESQVKFQQKRSQSFSFSILPGQPEMGINTTNR